MGLFEKQLSQYAIEEASGTNSLDLHNSIASYAPKIVLSNTGADNSDYLDLPSPYIQLDYIEATGDAVLDANIVPNQDTKIVCKFQLTKIGANYPFGVRQTSQTNICYLSGGASVWNPRFGASSTLTYGATDTAIHTIEMSKSGIYWDGTLISTPSQTAFTCPGNLYIGGLNNNGAVAYGKTRIMLFEIYQNGILVKKYVPSKNAINEQIGLYDSVSQIFEQPTLGTGSFVAGPQTTRKTYGPINTSGITFDLVRRNIINVTSKTSTVTGQYTAISSNSTKIKPNTAYTLYVEYEFTNQQHSTLMLDIGQGDANSYRADISQGDPNTLPTYPSGKHITIFTTKNEITTEKYPYLWFRLRRPADEDNLTSTCVFTKFTLVEGSHPELDYLAYKKTSVTIPAWHDIPLGKNLCDADFFTRNKISATYQYVPIYVGKGNKVTASIQEKMPLGLSCYCVIGYENSKGSGNSSAGWIYHKTASSLCKQQVTFTSTEDFVYLNINSPSTFFANCGYLQIEISPTATAYEPTTYSTVNFGFDKDEALIIDHQHNLVKYHCANGMEYDVLKYTYWGKLGLYMWLDSENNYFSVTQNSGPMNIKIHRMIHGAYYTKSQQNIDVVIDGSEYTITANPENIFEVANEYGLEMIIK